MSGHVDAERGACVMMRLWNFTKLSLTVGVKQTFICQLV